MAQSSDLYCFVYDIEYDFHFDDALQCLLRPGTKLTEREGPELEVE